MFNKIILILIISMILLGTAMIFTPLPVLWAMGCLILLALSVVLRSEQPG
jgi:hypothetical protein